MLKPTLAIALAFFISVTVNSPQRTNATGEKNAVISAVSSYILRNGDFSTYQGWSRPADWNPISDENIGVPKFKYELPPEQQSLSFKNPGALAVIDLGEKASGAYYQNVHLLNGDYTFVVEALSPLEAEAKITAGKYSTNIPSTGDWEVVRLDFSGEGATGIFLSAQGAGAVKFRYASVRIKKLASDVISFADGTKLGGIVLPENPDEAEKYAAYELQKFITKMTGFTPGLKDRDEIYQGRMILIGAACDQSVRDMPCRKPVHPTDK